MATQEERLTALEKNFAIFQRETIDNIVEGKENHTILLGVMRSQGQDIKKIFARLETVEQGLNEVKATLNEHTTRFDRVEALLAQVLERLPK
ncbi:MAG: hypothetical protein NVS4B11_34350 [Ktedonobacteraceae bacterium]